MLVTPNLDIFGTLPFLIYESAIVKLLAHIRVEDVELYITEAKIPAENIGENKRSHIACYLN